FINVSQDRKKLQEGLKIFTWTKTITRLIGLWPLIPNYYIFDVCIIYLTVMMVLQSTYLYKSLKDVEKLIDIMTENIAFFYIYMSAVMLRVNNKQLGRVIVQAVTDYNISAFRDSDEVDVFIQFINRARIMMKGLIIYYTAGEILWYFIPIMSLCKYTSDNMMDDNNKTMFVLPYEIWLFYEIDSTTSYFFTYLFLLPAPVIGVLVNIATDCCLIFLVFYISGKMAVLTMRIEALKSTQDNCRNELGKIIAEHGKLLGMGDEIRDAYSVILLVYFLVSNFILCILGYQILIGFMNNQLFEVVQYMLYFIEMYFMLALYCMISEHLTSESLKCGEAFYQCPWYNFPLDCSKNIILSIARSQKPLGLQAGKFTTFSSVTLTDVSKTAAGYLSVLRNFLIVDE
ncbi:GSCOCT00004018001.3-RA-CDS, partial [Cotesia congregata]